MQGNPDSNSSGADQKEYAPPSTAPAVDYAIRLTFAVVHAALLTIFSFCLAFLFPSFSHFLFSLFGCVLAPALSLILSIFCNVCVEYVSKSTVTWKHIFRWSLIPPLGVIGISLVILPLEMMPSLGFRGPVNTLVITSIIMNFIVTTLLQIYSAKHIQSSSSSESEAILGPI